MLSKTRLVFNEKASGQIGTEAQDLTFLIRTDACFATNGFRQKLISLLQQNAVAPVSSAPVFNPRALGQASGDELEKVVKKSVHAAYEEWGHSILDTIARHVNYDLYDINESIRRLSVEFHDSHSLAEQIANNADKFLAAQPGHKADVPVVFVSLDEMFHECRAPWGEVAFSRLFSLKGDQQFGYIARPGRPPIDDQVKVFTQLLKDMQMQYGEKIRFVLLEDNVRHAKMLNWVIDLMDGHGVFNHADLACISTCFCSASQEERQAIVHKGRSIPLVAAVEFSSKSFEVSTPRDLFFDGYVVEVEGELTRLPGLFMDVEKLFKVCPDKVESFREEVRDASMRFCQRIENEWNVNVPLSWFGCAKAISHVTGADQETPMLDILKKLDISLHNAMSPDAAGGPTGKPAAPSV